MSVAPTLRIKQRVRTWARTTPKAWINTGSLLPQLNEGLEFYGGVKFPPPPRRYEYRLMAAYKSNHG